MKGMIVALLALLLAGCDAGTTAAAPSAPTQAQQVAAMSMGEKLLTVDQGHPVEKGDPRIAQIDSLLVAVADRFAVEPERVADMAIVTSREIRKTDAGEAIEDVLDAPLVATVGDHGDMPKLASVLALYAATRASGSPPNTAKRVTYTFLHMKQ